MRGPTFCLVCALTCALAGAAPARAACSLDPSLERTVARVVDGETLALDDGTEVRLIGALAPRAGDVRAQPGRWPPEQATVGALERLVLGRTVSLAFPGDRTDRYGRLQAHVFVTVGTERVWLQAELLQRGLARAYRLRGPSPCIRELISWERRARTAGVGLWASPAYRVRSAYASRRLRSDTATYQLVRGRVRRVGTGRSRIYLNLKARAWPGMTVSVARSDRDGVAALGGDLHSLVGRTVLARGWIEQRRGPAIDASGAGFVELLEPDPAIKNEARPAERPGALEFEPYLPIGSGETRLRPP